MARACQCSSRARRLTSASLDGGPYGALTPARGELVRDPLDLLRDRRQLERIITLDRRKRRRLTVSTVQQFPHRRDPLRCFRSRIVRDVQQNRHQVTRVRRLTHRCGNTFRPAGRITRLPRLEPAAHRRPRCSPADTSGSPLPTLRRANPRPGHARKCTRTHGQRKSSRTKFAARLTLSVQRATVGLTLRKGKK